MGILNEIGTALSLASADAQTELYEGMKEGVVYQFAEDALLKGMAVLEEIAEEKGYSESTALRVALRALANRDTLPSRMFMVAVPYGTLFLSYLPMADRILGEGASESLGTVRKFSKMVIRGGGTRNGMEVATTLRRSFMELYTHPKVESLKADALSTLAQRGELKAAEEIQEALKPLDQAAEGIRRADEFRQTLQSKVPTTTREGESVSVDKSM